MRVLGIESSCDETGVAIYATDQGLLSQALYSQINLHQQYGGVVPELASRHHLQWFVFLVEQALTQAGLKPSALDAIAYTAGPGLIGALLSGACFAKSLAYSLSIPALAVHHLEAHWLVTLLDFPSVTFPFLVLLVSGGHTQLLLVHALGQYELLGETLDDAVGEAFDKIAKLMGLPYPGGALLADLADNHVTDKTAHLFSAFPRPLLDRPGLELSFSGLKTHALTVWQKSKQDRDAQIAIAHAFQQAVVDTLVVKCRRALQQTGIKQLIVAGGVGANQALRQALIALMNQSGGSVLFPRKDYCTDNGVMVAYAGSLYLSRGHRDSSLAIEVKARWPL